MSTLAADFARIVAAVPASQRSRAKAHLESCSASARRQAWELVVSSSPLTRARLQELASELVTSADAGPLAPVACGCGSPPSVRTADGVLLCASCVTPFDR